MRDEVVTDGTVHARELKDRVRERRWIEEIIETGGHCLTCGYSENPLIIEKHHLAGGHNSDITIPVCPNCHQELSRRQKGWDKAWIKPDNPPKKRLAFMLRGISELLNLIARLLREASDALLREGDNETTQRL